MFEFLVVSIEIPLQVGVYKNKILQHIYTSEEKTSQGLLPLLELALQNYPIETITYVRGPGSHMSTKLTYIMLKSIEVVKGIPLQGCSGFELNNNQPIKALGKMYFIKEKETIITKILKQPVVSHFELPKNIETLKIDNESTPNYILPAV